MRPTAVQGPGTSPGCGVAGRPGRARAEAAGLTVARQTRGRSEPDLAPPSRALATRPGGRSAQRLAAAVSSACRGQAGTRCPRTRAAPLRARSPWIPLPAARGGP